MNNIIFAGHRLKELRTSKNMSQQQLGSVIKVTKVSICGYETGTRLPSLDTLIELANYFGVSTDYLLGREVKTDEDVYISRDDVEIINELKKYKELYKIIISDIPRIVKLIDKKI